MEWIAHPASTVNPSRIASAPHTAPVVLAQDISGETATQQLSTFLKHSFNDAGVRVDSAGLVSEPSQTADSVD